MLNSTLKKEKVSLILSGKIFSCTGKCHKISPDLRLDPSFFFVTKLFQTGAAPEWRSVPYKSYESNFIHRNLCNSENSIRAITSFCRPLFCHSSIVKYTSPLLHKGAAGVWGLKGLKPLLSNLNIDVYFLSFSPTL